jgi:serine/threonine protein kinase
MTRETISINKLNPNRVIKKMADDFRSECQRKKSRYKYKLDVDVKKTEEISYLKTNTKTFYQAEWIKNNDSKIMLVHLNGENAEKFAEINCQLELHPNIVRTFGRVEHNDTSILLLQEYLPRETFLQLIKHTNQKLSITILDTILYQIASGLAHLANHGIIHGNVTTNNVFIYQFGEIPENILVKLTNIGDLETSNNDTDKMAPELLKSKDCYSEKSDVYAFGILTQELYSLELATNDKDLIDRQTLFTRCLATDPNERPTFNELKQSIMDLMSKRKFLYPTIHE